MAKKNSTWFVRELSYLLLAPFLVLIGVVGYGILFDKWHRDPLEILEYSGLVYAILIVYRFLGWSFRAFLR
jgi:hypothetical protein